VDLFVARQPIFDLRGQVAAYELLYRRGAGSLAADGESTRQMSLDVVIQSFLEIGLERITRGKTAFINFSREMLLSSAYDLLDPKAVVIELLEDVEADPEVLAACDRLVGLGYRLALDDFV
jgi:c-di-GMP-related signal transduction protein